MASPVAHLKSIIHFAKELLSYAEAGGDKEHAFNLVVDSKELADADDALDSMVEALKDELKESAEAEETEVEKLTEVQLSLLKEVVNTDEPRHPKEVVSMLNDQLRDRKLDAFGGSPGLWGASKTKHTYKVTKVTSSYNDGNFMSVDIHLAKYDARREEPGEIYTDPTFLKALKELLKKLPVGKYIKSLDYSEHGMQGNSYVNLDVTVKNLAEKK